MMKEFLKYECQTETHPCFLDAIILYIQDDIDASSLQQLVSNSNGKEEGNLYDYQPALDLTALLRSLDIPTTSWFVPYPLTLASLLSDKRNNLGNKDAKFYPFTQSSTQNFIFPPSPSFHSLPLSNHLSPFRLPHTLFKSFHQKDSLEEFSRPKIPLHPSYFY